MSFLRQMPWLDEWQAQQWVETRGCTVVCNYCRIPAVCSAKSLSEGACVECYAARAPVRRERRYASLLSLMEEALHINAEYNEKASRRTRSQQPAQHTSVRGYQSRRAPRPGVSRASRRTFVRQWKQTSEVYAILGRR